MTSLTGAVVRFMHIWPYETLDERTRLRASICRSTFLLCVDVSV
jgi:hypothetical protein